jgi:polyisoprenoid-binding protein YceI
VTFDVELEGVGVDGRGGKHLGASATITIDRKDFGLVWNQPIQNGVMVGDKVKIDVGVEALDAASAKAMGLAA